MYQHKGLTYYGKKGSDFVERVFPLLPVGINHLVEACMGSGVISANLHFAGMKQQTAFELDRGVCNLNKQIQSHPYELLDLLRKMPYDKDFYTESLEILKQYNATGILSHSELELAQREYGVLTMSFNSMRITYRRLDGYTKYSDMRRRRESKVELDRLKNNIYRDMPEIIIGCSNAWRHLNIINDDFMDHPEVFTEGKETLAIVDPPYQYIKRGIENRKTSAGYMVDWDDNEHLRFLRFVGDIQKQPNHSRIMICSNFRLNSNGEINIQEFQDDIYTRYLLPLGFRMVIIRKRFTSEIKKWQSDHSHKQAKVEVVYINYTDILGDWNDYQYYDYADVYGETNTYGQELAV